MYGFSSAETKSLSSQLHEPEYVSNNAAVYISKVTIQLDGYTCTKEPSKKLPSSTTSSLSQRQKSNDPFSPEMNISRDSFRSYSVLSQVAKKHLGSAQRTSSPKPQTSVSPRGRQQNVSSVCRKHIVSEEKTRKQFNDFATSKDVNSRHLSVMNQDNDHSPVLQFQTTEHSYRDETYKKDWYFDILRRMEDLNWSYQKLETEYAFLERFMDEQKEDLRKVKNCSKHQNSKTALSASELVN